MDIWNIFDNSIFGLLQRKFIGAFCEIVPVPFLAMVHWWFDWLKPDWLKSSPWKLKGTVGTNQIRPYALGIWFSTQWNTMRHEPFLGENISSNQAKYCVTCGWTSNRLLRSMDCQDRLLLWYLWSIRSISLPQPKSSMDVENGPCGEPFFLSLLEDPLKIPCRSVFVFQTRRIISMSMVNSTMNHPQVISIGCYQPFVNGRCMMVYGIGLPILILGICLKSKKSQHSQDIALPVHCQCQEALVRCQQLLSRLPPMEGGMKISKRAAS